MKEASPKWMVVTVLKTGGDFNFAHVTSLRDQVKKHFKQPHSFYCFTDTYIPGGVNTIRLWHSWKGWWSKLEIFVLGKNGHYSGRPVLFLDLDTVITDDFDLPIPDMNEFWMIRDFVAWGDERYRSRWWASGLMMWRGDFRKIFFAAKQEGIQHISSYYKWDQIYIRHILKNDEEEGVVKFCALNDVLRIQSFKIHHLDTDKLEDPPQIVCFHGKPRPWDREDLTWVREARHP